MNSLFTYAEFGGTKPPTAEKDENGTYTVTRNVREVARNGETVYVGEVALMREAAYAAYVGAQEAEVRREQEIVDETVLNLIEEGSL